MGGAGCGPCRPGRWNRSLPGLFRFGRFWGTHSQTSPKAGFLLQSPPTLLQFPQEEYNVPFRPDLQRRLFLLRASFRLRQGFLTGRLCSGRTGACNPSCAPMSPAPLGSPRAWNAAGLSPPHAALFAPLGRPDRHRGADRREGRRTLSVRRQVSETVSPRAGRGAAPALPYGTPTPALGVAIVSYRWGNRGAERLDDWLEPVSGWRAASSSTPPPHGCAGRTSLSTARPRPPIPGLAGSPVPVPSPGLCCRPRGLVFLLLVLSFQARLEPRLSRRRKRGRQMSDNASLFLFALLLLLFCYRHLPPRWLGPPG